MSDKLTVKFKWNAASENYEAFVDGRMVCHVKESRVYGMKCWVAYDSKGGRQTAGTRKDAVKGLLALGGGF